MKLIIILIVPVVLMSNFILAGNTNNIITIKNKKRKKIDDRSLNQIKKEIKKFEDLSENKRHKMAHTMALKFYQIAKYHNHCKDEYGEYLYEPEFFNIDRRYSKEYGILKYRSINDELKSDRMIIKYKYKFNISFSCEENTELFHILVDRNIIKMYPDIIKAREILKNN